MLHYGNARHIWDVTVAQYLGALKVRIFGNRNHRKSPSMSKPIADSSVLTVSANTHVAIWAYNFLHQDFYPDFLPTNFFSGPSDKDSDIPWNGLYFAGKLDRYYSFWGSLRTT